MNKLQFKGTQGTFVPEPKPTYNPGADAYQVAILQIEKSRIIPGFAFGETPEICMANAHLFANSKLVLQALSELMALYEKEDRPTDEELIECLQKCQRVLDMSYGQYKIVSG